MSMKIVQNTVMHVKQTIQSLWLCSAFVKALARCLIQALLHYWEVILDSDECVVQVSLLYIQKVLFGVWYVVLWSFDQSSLFSMPVVYFLDFDSFRSVSHCLHRFDRPIPLLKVRLVFQHCIYCSFPSFLILDLVAVIQGHYSGSVPTANEITWVIERYFFTWHFFFGKQFLWHVC